MTKRILTAATLSLALSASAVCAPAASTAKPTKAPGGITLKGASVEPGGGGFLYLNLNLRDSSPSKFKHEGHDHSHELYGWVAETPDGQVYRSKTPVHDDKNSGSGQFNLTDVTRDGKKLLWYNASETGSFQTGLWKVRIVEYGKQLKQGKKYPVTSVSRIFKLRVTKGKAGYRVKAR
ncbi:hypothetical protein [Nocardioides sp.]|uniref:hypothetical protein n=1 Tax=Nocardioides sp. TaxID=35761 RepID=UPI0026233E74|nr:hypothetical protein [Nocardioides sp.]